MANKTFNTRLKLKYDTYENWSTKNPTLLAGELAICVIPAESGQATNEPTVLMKCGDGASKFNELGWISGLSADNYAWSKSKTKPEYQASEIKNLEAYIGQKVQDTNTTYKLEADADDAHKFYLYAKELGAESWGSIPVSAITIPETVYTLVEGTAEGTVKFNGTDVKVHGLGSAAYTDSTDYDASGSADAALANAKTYADGKDAAIKAAKEAADAAQSDVDALAGKVGTVPDDKTVVGMIAEAQAAATYDDTEVKASIKANADAIGVLNGASTVAGSVDKKVADAINDFATKVSEDGTVNTFKELIDYAATHQGEYSTLSGDVQKNTTAIATLNGTGVGSVSKAVADAKSELESSISDHTSNTTVHITAAERTAWNGKTTMSEVEEKGYQTEAQVKATKVNAAIAADKLATAVAINLTGDATGTADFDGSEEINIAVTVVDDSHNHVISNIDGLQDALDAKATPADIAAEIGKLDFTDAAVEGEVVSAVSEEDGKISVTRRQVKIDELGQDAYIIFDCGSASTII